MHIQNFLHTWHCAFLRIAALRGDLARQATGKTRAECEEQCLGRPTCTGFIFRSKCELIQPDPISSAAHATYGACREIWGRQIGAATKLSVHDPPSAAPYFSTIFA